MKQMTCEYHPFKGVKHLVPTEDTPFTITSDELWAMKGRQLLTRLGIETYLQEAKSFTVLSVHGDCTEWMAWQTMGRGKNYGQTYLHLSSESQVRIVTENGEDTGSRCWQTTHVRGYTHRPVGEMKLV